MVANIATRCRFGDLVTGFIVQTETNQTTLARRIGIPESTLRAWLNDYRSPQLDWLLANAHRLPSALLCELLNELAAGRFVVEPIESDQSSGAALVHDALDVTAKCAHLAQVVHEAEADGFITREERSAILHEICIVAASLKRLSVHVATAVGRTLVRPLIGGRA